MEHVTFTDHAARIGAAHLERAALGGSEVPEKPADEKPLPAPVGAAGSLRARTG